MEFGTSMGKKQQEASEAQGTMKEKKFHFELFEDSSRSKIRQEAA